MDIFDNKYYFDEDLEKLRDFSDVNRISELVDLLRNIKDSNFLEKMSKIVEKNIFSPNIKNIDNNNIDFFNYIKKQLSKSQFNSSFVSFNDFLSMYSIIELSYSYHSSKNMKNYEYKSIVEGDIGKRITYYVEDYSKVRYIPELAERFFDNIELVKWADEESERLNTILFDILIDLTMNYKFFSYLNASILGCVHYLELCNALKHKKLQVTAEDVVVAFITTINILMTDIREFIPIIKEDEKESIKNKLYDYKDKLLLTLKGSQTNTHKEENFKQYKAQTKKNKNNDNNKNKNKNNEKHHEKNINNLANNTNRTLKSKAQEEPKEIKKPKEFKIANEPRKIKESIESKESKNEIKEIKKPKEFKIANEPRKIKESVESKEIIESKVAKETETIKEAKEIKKIVPKDKEAKRIPILKNIKNIKNTENTKDIKNSKNFENGENTKNNKIIENIRHILNIRSIGVKKHSNTEIKPISKNNEPKREKINRKFLITIIAILSLLIVASVALTQFNLNPIDDSTNSNLINNNTDNSNDTNINSTNNNSNNNSSNLNSSNKSTGLATNDKQTNSNNSEKDQNSSDIFVILDDKTTSLAQLIPNKFYY